MTLELVNKAFNYLFGESDDFNHFESDHKLDYNFIVD